MHVPPVKGCCIFTVDCSAVREAAAVGDSDVPPACRRAYLVVCPDLQCDDGRCRRAAVCPRGPSLRLFFLP